MSPPCVRLCALNRQVNVDANRIEQYRNRTTLIVMQSIDEIILGIPMGPVGPMKFPWEWELLS